MTRRKFAPDRSLESSIQTEERNARINEMFDRARRHFDRAVAADTTRAVKRKLQTEPRRKP
jgi:hypothetical protein